MNIENFIKENNNLVIDLDGVEYLLGDESVLAISRGEQKIPLAQLFDGKIYLIDVGDIEKSLGANGIVDYLDKK